MNYSKAAALAFTTTAGMAYTLILLAISKKENRKLKLKVAKARGGQDALAEALTRSLEGQERHVVVSVLDALAVDLKFRNIVQHKDSF